MTALMQLTIDDLKPAAPETLYGWGGLCTLPDTLCWERYGYDGAGGPPVCASEALTTAKRAAAIVKPGDCRWSVVMNGPGSGAFTVWDEANPWVEPWSVNFSGYGNEEHARQSYEKEFKNHQRLHDGTIDALLHYQQTGEPILSTWMGDRIYWKQPGYNPAKQVFVKENQPGLICFEKFNNPDHPGYIHVTVQARAFGKWVAECEAEGPNRYRRSFRERFEATTYEDARRLAEEWITAAREWGAQALANQVERYTWEEHGNQWTGTLISVWGNRDCHARLMLYGDGESHPGARSRDGAWFVTVDRAVLVRLES